jgi:hypothetical protein
MSCDKLKFDTQAEAKEAMIKVPPKPTGQVPFMVYYHRPCRKWHYTSKQEMKRRH